MSLTINKSKMIKGFPSYSDSKLIPKYIVIHDTAGSSAALQEATRLQSSSQYNNGVAHFYTDDKECYQLIECNIKAYHAGDGPTGKGNGQSISIEVCKSLASGGFTSETQKATYQKALDNAYKLAADLCKKYNISSNNILQHKDLSATACPYTQKVLFGSYEKALSNAKSKIGGYMATEKKYCTVIVDFSKMRFKDPENKIKYIMRVDEIRGIYRDENITKKDNNNNFKPGDEYPVNRVVGWREKYFVHEFISNNGRKYYVAYLAKV